MDAVLDLCQLAPYGDAGVSTQQGIVFVGRVTVGLMICLGHGHVEHCEVKWNGSNYNQNRKKMMCSRKEEICAGFCAFSISIWRPCSRASPEFQVLSAPFGPSGLQAVTTQLMHENVLSGHKAP